MTGLGLEIGADLSAISIEIEDFRFMINGRTVFIGTIPVLVTLH